MKKLKLIIILIISVSYSFQSATSQISGNLFPFLEVRKAVKSPTEAKVFDLNGDNKPEIIVPNFNGISVSIFMNNVDAVNSSAQLFKTRIDLPSQGNDDDLEVVDLDGDGKKDIVTTGIFGVSIMRNKFQSGIMDGNSFDSYISLSTAHNSFSMAIGDLDSDGKPDIVVNASSIDSSFITIFKNNCSPGSISSSNFTRIDYKSSNKVNYTDITVEDLNGDGKPEIICMVDTVSKSYISILKNKTETGKIDLKSFADRARININATKFYFTDIDGNKNKELIISTGNFSIWENTCYAEMSHNYCYTQKAAYYGISSVSQILATDLDNDNKKDLVVSTFSDGIYFLKNTSTSGTIDDDSYDKGKDTDSKGRLYPIKKVGHFVLEDIDMNNQKDLIVSNVNQGLNDSVYIYHNAFMNVTGIKEINDNENIKVSLFPNPATKELNIIHPASSMIIIYNLQGCKLLSEYSKDNKSVIDIRSLANGIYIVQIQNMNQNLTKKITIQD